MTPCLQSPHRPYRILGLAWSCHFATMAFAVEPIDRDGDGTSDFWQSLYGVPSVSSGADSDGDGIPDEEEAEAGTNPFDPSSLLQVIAFEITPAGPPTDQLLLTFAGVAGKSYRLQQSAALDLAAWISVGPVIVPEADGPTRAEFEVPDTVPRSFYRLLVFDVDGDRDGLSAFDERIVGTSDDNPNTGGDPRGSDHMAGMDWLAEHDPGADPNGVPDNLREIDVAWVQQPIRAVAPALLVTATGTGGWHQLTEWSVSDTGVTTEVATVPPIDGHHPKIRKLEPDTTAPSSPKKFVTGRIRDDGNLWLSSRACSEGGGFLHYRSIGYGSNANVNVFDYAIAQRPITSLGLVLAYQVVTPVLARPQGSSAGELRVLTWRVDVLTGELTGLRDSGPLAVSDLPADLDLARIGIAHLAQNQFQITYTSSNDSLSRRAIWTSDGGVVTYGGGGTLAGNIRGSSFFSVEQEASAIGGVATNGYVTATRAPDGHLKMGVWDLLEENPDDYESYLLSDNELDLSPNSNGVALPAPALTDSWDSKVAAGDHLGEVLAVGDFDGDGYDDLAIGAPTRDTSGMINAGAVYIIEGDSDGITSEPYHQLWTQDSPGIIAAVETGDLFGYSLAAGDFNGDSIDDLAIGAAGEDVGGVAVTGAVFVLYGTPFGLSSTNHRVIIQENVGLSSGAFDYFGWSLAAGDFNGDTRDDLAIGILNETVGGDADAGAVVVMWATSAGLDYAFRTVLHQDVAGTHDTAEVGDGFGRVLAAGDFDQDSIADLAVGIPREDYDRVSNAGAVQVFYGSPNGFANDIFVTQAGFEDGEDIFGAPEDNDFFGNSLVAADFNDDGAADLAIGVPGEDTGAIADAGAVNVLYGTAFLSLGLTWGNNLLIEPDEFTPIGGSLPSASEAGDDFGRAVTAGDFNKDGFVDLVVGAPLEDLLSDPEDAGAAFYVSGSAAGLVAGGSRALYQGLSHSESDGNNYVLNGTPAMGDQFAAALAAGDFNADGASDLVVGIPRKDFDEDAPDSGAIQIIPGSKTDGLTFSKDEEWTARVREIVRAMITDLGWEESNGVGGGKLFGKGDLLEWRHVASVTKSMTLLLAVKAIEDGDAHLDDMVDISELAGTTGGSTLATYDAGGTEIKDENGDEIPFIQTSDSMPLRLLLGGMMNESCNRSSVAIGQYLAEQVKGDPDEFINMMNDEAASLNLDNSLFGHPAGGWATVPQDLITLLREGNKHPLFVELGGIVTYGLVPPTSDFLCGTDAEDEEKCNGPFDKINTIGDYAGRAMWKGGNIGLWFASDQANDVPPRPVVPWATNSAVAIVKRMDRDVALGLMQSGDRTDDSQRLLDYGLRKIFTPDLRAELEHPKPGGVIGPDGPVRVKNFAIDRIAETSGVTAIIDDYENLQLDIWILNPVARTITFAGQAKRTYHLLDGATSAPPALVDLAEIPTSAAIEDYFTANLDGDHLDLALWRLGEEP